MVRPALIALLRPGWSMRRFGLLGTAARLIMFAFVFHVSGVAHFVADVLLEDDMTCADELAHHPHKGSAAPQCPASQGVGHGQGVTPPSGSVLPVAPPSPERPGSARDVETEPSSAPNCSIERPPRA